MCRPPWRTCSQAARLDCDVRSVSRHAFECATLVANTRDAPIFYGEVLRYRSLSAPPLLHLDTPLDVLGVDSVNSHQQNPPRQSSVATRQATVPTTRRYASCGKQSCRKHVCRAQPRSSRCAGRGGSHHGCLAINSILTYQELTCLKRTAVRLNGCHSQLRIYCRVPIQTERTLLAPKTRAPPVLGAQKWTRTTELKSVGLRLPPPPWERRDLGLATLRLPRCQPCPAPCPARPSRSSRAPPRSWSARSPGTMRRTTGGTSSACGLWRGAWRLRRCAATCGASRMESSLTARA